MGYALNMADGDGFLRVRVSGENDPETLRRYLREVYEVCAKLGSPAVLIEENLHGMDLAHEFQPPHRWTSNRQSRVNGSRIARRRKGGRVCWRRSARRFWRFWPLFCSLSW